MDYSDADTMARELVKIHANSKKVYSMVMEKFGESPSVNKIAGMRGSFVTGDPANKRKIPKDFAEKAKGMSLSEILRQFKCKHETARRWCAEVGIVPRKITSSHNAKPIPDDFYQVAPTKTKAELKRYYNIKYDGTLDRWLRHTKITPRRFVPVNNRMSQMGKVFSTHNLHQLNNRDMYEEAADVIRRERFPVNRCNENGSFNPTGKYYRVGWSVLTKEELLERAERYKRKAL